MAEFNRNLRYSLHKASLLCLLVQGLEISRRCNDTLLQARLFSLVPRELLCTPADKLFKILKWFVARKDHLLATVTDSEESSRNQESVSDQRKTSQLNATEMLVALLRALNLRTRLVLALNPISFKPSKEKKSDPQLDSTQPEAGKRITPSQEEPAALPQSLTGISDPSPSPNFFKLMERLRQNSDTNMDCTTEGGEGEMCDRDLAVSTEHSLRGGGKRRAKLMKGSAVKKRRIDASEKDNKSASCEQKGTCRSVGRKGKGRKQVAEKMDSSTASETSPYFGQEKATSHRESMADVGSSEESDDADFLLPTRRKSLQKLSFSSDSSSSDDGEGVGGGGEGGNKRLRKGKVVREHPKKTGKVKEKTLELKGNRKKVPTTPCGVYGRKFDGTLEKKFCVCCTHSELKQLQLPNSCCLYNVDESSSWAEVFSEDQKKYVCLHLPSSTVGQPKMCEKHSPHKISYIIGIENG